MSRTLIIRPEAEAEMAEAHDWYEERASGLGAEFLVSADACFKSILHNPHMYPQVYKSARKALLRRFPYQVLFVEEKEQVTILAVFHSKRNPKHWQDRFRRM